MSRLPCLPAPRPPPFFLAKHEAGGGTGTPADAEAPDRSNLDEMDGYLQKMSQRGTWQTRFFTLNNGYLNYFKDKNRDKLLGALDLSKVRSWRAHPAGPRFCSRAPCPCPHRPTLLAHAHSPFAVH